MLRIHPGMGGERPALSQPNLSLCKGDQYCLGDVESDALEAIAHLPLELLPARAVLAKLKKFMSIPGQLEGIDLYDPIRGRAPDRLYDNQIA